MKRFWKVFLTVCMIFMLFAQNGMGIQAADHTQITIINDFDIGTKINRVQYAGEWKSDQNYPDLFYNGDDHWTAPDVEPNQFESTYMEILFYGNRIRLYGNKEPMAGIQYVSIDGVKVAEIDAYAGERELGVCLFDSENAVELTNDVHVLRYQSTAGKNEASSGYNMQFDYAEVTAETTGKLQYAQFSQETYDTEVGEQKKIMPELFPGNADAEMTWSSADPAVAVVLEDGTIQALAKGETIIRAEIDSLDIDLSFLLHVDEHLQDLTVTDVNDDQSGTEMFQFSYEGPWVHEGGYPDRFYGGDEHWITKNQFGDSLPSFNFSFVGRKVELYGHKVDQGALADVYIDGEKAGEIDYYSPVRQEKQLLYASEIMPEGEHVISVKLNGKHNENSGSTLEAAIDFARFYHSEREFYPSSIVLTDTEVMLEEGMYYQPTYRILPSYATVIPDVRWSSSNPDIAKVDEKSGEIIALNEGTATIIAKLDGTEIEANMTVLVRECKEEVAALVQDNNTHTYPEKYFDYISSCYDTGTASQRSWKGSAWKNDIATSRIDILTKANAYPDAALYSSDLIDEKGNRIDKENISFTFMEDTLSHTNQQRIMDIITNQTKKNLDAQSLHSAWVSIYVPKDTVAGTYKGTLKIVGRDKTLASFEYTLEVIDLMQPDLRTDETQIELWMYPYSSNRYYANKTTEEYFGDSVEDLYYVHLNDAYQKGLESQLELYRKIGGDAITVTVVEDPWNSQTPDPYPSMVKWTRKADGSFSFDYTDLDKWIALNMKHGIDKQIKSFSLSCWGNRITYFDEASGKVVSESPASGSDRWETLWRAFLIDYTKHMDEKGWFDITYMAMDERPLEEIIPVLDLIDSVKNKDGRSLKTSLAVYNYDAESIFDRIDDLSLAYAMGSSKVEQLARERKEKGLLTTMYTCGAQNSAMLNQPGESAYSIYHSYKYGTDGFLRWALDAFNENPLETSQHDLFASGDIYLIYPDVKDSSDMQAQSTPRFEKLAEGVRDMDKLRYLRENYPLFEDEIKNLIASFGQNAMSLEVSRVRNELFRISKEALYGKKEPVIRINEGDVVLRPGEKIQLSLSVDPKNLPETLAEKQQINDFSNQLSYCGETWATDEGYDDLFFNGDDHWCAPADAQDMKNYGYEFDFYGDMFAVVGNRESLSGILDVYIDGVHTATIDPYQQTTARFQKIYISERLTLGNHHVKVIGSGTKNELSEGYNIQLDYIETYIHTNPVWTSSNPASVTVDEEGTLQALAAGSSEVSVSWGNCSDSITVTVEANEEKDNDGKDQEDEHNGSKEDLSNDKVAGGVQKASITSYVLLFGAALIIIVVIVIRKKKK